MRFPFWFPVLPGDGIRPRSFGWRCAELRFSSVLLLAGCLAGPLAAADQPPGAAPAAALPVVSDQSDWTFHAQSTGIEQWHYGFPAEYSGPESLEPVTEDKHTVTLTVFLGRKLWDGGALYYNPEITQGNGLSGAVGIAGFSNGEATRAGSNNPQYDTARLYLSQTFNFGGGNAPVADGPNQLAGELDTVNLNVMVGKFSVTDVFDANNYTHDARSQFLNWALVDSGAFDFPADTKGYTVGGAAILTEKSFALEYGIFMEPSSANGPSLDPHVGKAFGQVLEWDQQYTWGGHAGTVRPFLYWNRADMGSYSAAVADPAANLDITQTRAYRSKVGAGLSWDQEVATNLGAFARLSWDDGHTETWAYTEIDRSLATGLSLKGAGWGRPEDVVGLAGIGDGLSPQHRAYLAAGGVGFIVGDGALNYGYEEIVEAYYAVKVCKWLTLTPDYQYAEHPGYNRDRGGVSIYAVRAHVEY